MQIKIEDLQPKNIINFYLPQSLITGSALLFTANDKFDSDFLAEIFDVSGVQSCLFADNLLSIKFTAEVEKEDIIALVPAIADEYLSVGKAIIPPSDYSLLIDKCEALADALIRPTLNRDKGDINIKLLPDNVLGVTFTGHCAGCPYAQNTLQNVVMRTFKRYLPQITDVKLEE